jgi:arylsulfatase
MTDQPRNVVLLSFDALRADHLGWYGYDRDTSPVLDELAQECLSFENAYSASSHTREAVPALLTGRYPDEAVDGGYRLSSDSVASTLSDVGFTTGGFHSNPYVSRAYGFDRGFDTFDDDLHLGRNRFVALAQRALDKLRNRHYARADEINRRSLSWLDSLDDDQPFFLWNHYMDTHGPYEPPDDYRTLYADRAPSNREAQSLYQRAISDPESITDAERRLLINLYDAEIRYNDSQVGEFLDALRERDHLQESLVIVTADHGDAFGEHGYYEHPRHLHEELTRVPLLVRPPGGRGEVVSTPASTLDITATIEDLYGSAKHSNDAISLLDLDDRERMVFSQARGEGEASHLRRFAVRTTLKSGFCEHDQGTGAIDFEDTTDQSLRRALRSHVQSRGEKAVDDSSTRTSEVNEEIDRRLEALGYRE